MTTDQRLERIESLLECLLEVQKFHARLALKIATGTSGDSILDDIHPIEHPKPAPEPEDDKHSGRGGPRRCNAPWQ